MSDGSPPVGGVRAYWIGSVVAWIAVWLGIAVALSGSGQFGKVLPILVAGNLIGLGADALPGYRQLLGPAVVWAVILAGVMIVLGESPYLVGSWRCSPRSTGTGAGQPVTLLADSRPQVRGPSCRSRSSSAVRLYARAATPRTNDIADAGTQDWPSTGGVAPIIVEAEGCARRV